MDYEKKYKEALERARAYFKNENYTEMADVFPEIKDSDDERIRKEIIHYILYKASGISAEQEHAWISYLEKQKEQEPNAEWSEEDEDMLNSCISSIEEAEENRYACKETDGDTSYDHEIAWLKSLPKRFNLQPKQEWNKKDENKLYQVIDTLLADKAEALRDNPRCKALHEAFDDMIDWLKSLRNRVGKEFLQPHWKPSEEQMEQLKSAADLPEFGPMVTTKKQYPALESLYSDLKKLM